MLASMRCGRLRGAARAAAVGVRTVARMCCREGCASARARCLSLRVDQRAAGRAAAGSVATLA
eukprot:7252179-Lingulodinium_polyedra.AAC.1